MKLAGTRTTTERVTIDINPRKALEALEQILWEKLNRPPGAEEINSNGVWESWTDTGHGSGLTDRYGPACSEQLELDAALKILKKNLRGTS